jgi:ribosome production factor 2
VCTTISPTTVYMMHCAFRLKRPGTSIPKMELVEVGPSMNLVVRRHRLPVESLQKEAMKTADHAKKVSLMEPSFAIPKIVVLYCKLWFP